MDGNYNDNNHFVKYYRIYLYLISTLVCLMPFIWWPWAGIAYELPRVWFILGTIDLLALLSIPILIRHQKMFTPSALILPLCLLFLAIAASALLGTDPNKSVWGNWWRLDGVVTITHLMIFAILVEFSSGLGITTIAVGIGLGALGTAVCAVIYGMLAILDANIPTVDGTIGIFFGQPNFLAGYLVVTLPFMYFVIHLIGTRLPNPLAIGFISIFPLIAILLTQSIGGVAGVVLFVVLLLINRSHSEARKRVLPFIGFGFIVVIVLIVYSLTISASQPPQILAESRQRILMKGLLAFTKRPILGWGWANYDHAFNSVDWPYHFEIDAYVDKAHSNLVEMLTTTGIIGFTLYIILIFVIGKRLYINYRYNKDGNLLPAVFLSSFILYLFHSQTNVTSIAEELIFWTMVGLAHSASTSDVNTLTALTHHTEP